MCVRSEKKRRRGMELWLIFIGKRGHLKRDYFMSKDEQKSIKRIKGRTVGGS